MQLPQGSVRLSLDQLQTQWRDVTTKYTTISRTKLNGLPWYDLLKVKATSLSAGSCHVVLSYRFSVFFGKAFGNATDEMLRRTARNTCLCSMFPVQSVLYQDLRDCLACRVNYVQSWMCRLYVILSAKRPVTAFLCSCQYPYTTFEFSLQKAVPCR